MYSASIDNLLNFVVVLLYLASLIIITITITTTTTYQKRGT